ncbi:D-amino-acid oxidase [Sphaerosporella brunnea]|uniref:D-amino-acid oxidase n=1 Tax=Sphaerosporella brunnea TaxID=1250544 RepID=A0A5J5EW54_9PEZI|nr:D-amino-acid oxidase [Sphaerosporella brunnea]
MTGKRNVVVVGAGVVGLTTALTLLRRGTYDVTVVSKHMPGDYNIEYTSPWAGANWWPVSSAGTREQVWDEKTFHELWRLAKDVPAAGVEVRNSLIYRRKKDENTPIIEWSGNLLLDDPWFKNLVPDFRKLRKDEIPKTFESGTSFKSVCINTAVYLPYLVSQCLELGATIKRATVKHICEAAGLHASGIKADVVVNCTGLMARSLGGVMDEKVIAARGQIVVVRNEAPAMINVSGTEDGLEETTYIMMRPAGGGTVIGGSYQKHNYESQADPNMTQRIMRRAIEICPELVKPGQGVEGLDIIRTYAGLRPLRIGGVRLEKENIEGVEVVHNYGAGGFGYQASYGMAEDAACLVDNATHIKAKL